MPTRDDSAALRRIVRWLGAALVLLAPAAACADCGTADARGVVHDVEVIDRDSGRVVHRGDVDLRPTLRRIEAGERAPVGHDDGTAFCARGLDRSRFDDPVYAEYVVLPTYLRSRAPGPQRVIVGTATGRAFYSCDHYRTFVPLEPRVTLPSEQRAAIERAARAQCRR